MATILKTYNSMGIPMNIQRGEPIPLDKTELYYSYEDAVAYAKSATAYVGQSIKVIDEATGKITWYIIGTDTENPLINKDAEVTAAVGEVDTKVSAVAARVDTAEATIAENHSQLSEAIKAYIQNLLVTGSVISFTKGDGTSESFNTTFVGTRAEYDTAYAENKIPVGTIVYITDEDDEDDDVNEPGNDEPTEGDITSSILGTGVLGYLVLG